LARLAAVLAGERDWPPRRWASIYDLVPKIPFIRTQYEENFEF